MKKDSLPQLIYQYPILGCYDKESSLIKLETNPSLISKLVFNFDWETPFANYHKRLAYYWGFSVSSFQDSIIEGKIESLTEDLDTLIYLVEVSVIPEKLTLENKKHLIATIKQLKNDDSFIIWWAGLAKHKHKKHQKRNILKDMAKLPVYQKEDDIDFAIIEEPSIEECLQGLGFEKDASKDEVVLNFKTNVRALQKKFHPDINNGEDQKFKQIQQFKDILEDWISEEN